MNKKKVGILVLVILLAVGFAAVSTTLIINGTAIFGTNDDDFDVIFTKAVIDNVDVSSTAISADGKTLTFETSELAIKDEESILDFTVKNNSSQYDANITMECVAEGENASEYYEITNTIPNVIEAKTSKEGTVTARLKKSSVEEIHETFTCTITATAVERTETGIDPYAVGTEVTLAGEKFNIISQTEDTVTMLAAYNLGTNYRQSAPANYVQFSSTYGWAYTPGPKEIDIQTWSTNPKTYINNYVSYLRTQTGDSTLSGNLISVAELLALGCTGVNSDYSPSGTQTCVNSSYSSWLLTGTKWYTRSAHSQIATNVWLVTADGRLSHDSGSTGYTYGIRPIITVSKDLLGY